MKIKLTALCAFASLALGSQLFATGNTCYDEYKTKDECDKNPFCDWIMSEMPAMCTGDCTNWTPPCAGPACEYHPGSMTEYCWTKSMSMSKK